MKHRVGIVGFGRMGEIRAQTAKSIGNVDITAVYDVDSQRIPSCFPVVSSPKEVIMNDAVDTVFICTPNYLNKQLTIESLQAGKHTFCEKPPAFNHDEVLEIKDAERKSGKKLMYGFNHRHHSSVKQIKYLVDSGDFGKIIWMRGRYGKSVDTSFFQTWRSKKEFAGGGILLDQGIHMLDLFLHLAGDFDQVKAFITNQYWKCDVEDNAFVLLKNSKSGLVASLHSTMTQWRHLFALEVFMEKGYLVLNGLKTSSGTYGDEVLSIAKNRTTAPAAIWEDEEKITFQTNQSWRNEVDHFFKAIENNTPIENGNSDDALHIMTLIDEIYREGKNG